MIEKEKYYDFINDDLIGATIFFEEELNLSEQVTVALYLIDNYNLSGNVKTILTSPHYKKILMAIKIENGKGSFEDGVLIERSVERFKLDNPEHPVTDNLIVDTDKINKFYLLIK